MSFAPPPSGPSATGTALGDISMSDLTLVVAGPEGSVLSQVRDTVDSWAGAGLARPLLWWSGCREGQHYARWSSAGAGDEAPLLAALASQPFSALRILSFLVIAAAGDERPLDTRQIAARVEEAVSERKASHQRLHKVNLLVPATGVAGLPVDLLSTYWDVNLVAADEDRATGAHSSEPVQHPGNLAPHAALALVTVAGLWPGMSGAPFDRDHRGAGEQEPRVRVIRSFARAVRSHGLVDEVAARMCDGERNQQWMVQVAGARQAPDPHALVASASREYFEAGGRALRCQHPRVPAHRPLARVSLGALLRWMWPFARNRSRALPDEWEEIAGTPARGPVKDFADESVVGEDATIAVTGGARTVIGHPALGSPLHTGGVEVAVALLDRLERLGYTPEQHTFGDAWPDLRALAFGLADGGPLPEGCTEPLEGTRRVVITDANAITPDPAEQPMEIDRDALPAGGPIAASTPWGGSPRPPDSWGGSPRPPDLAPLDPAHALLVKRLIRACREADGLAEGEAPGESVADVEERRLDDWLAGRSRSLLWLVGERVAEGAAAAEKGLMAALDRVREGVDALDVDGDEIATLRRRWRRLAVAALVLAALAVGLAVRDAVSPLVAAGIVLLVGFAGFAGSLFAFWLYLRRLFSVLDRHHRRRVRYEAAQRGAEHWARELRRLDAAYREYLDWAGIVGRTLHRGAGSPRDSDPAGPDLAGLVMPAAFKVATARTEEGLKRRIAAQVGERYFRQGWIGALYRDLARDSMSRCRFERGQPDSDPEPTPDTDSLARRYLLTDLVSGAPSRRLSTRRREEVIAYVRERAPDELFSTASDAGGREHSAGTFLTSLCPHARHEGDGEAFNGRFWRLRPYRVDRTTAVRLWLPKRSVTADPQTAGEAMEPTADGTPAALTFRTARLDVSAPVLWSDLLLFDRGCGREASPDPGAAGDPIGFGIICREGLG